MSLKIFSSQLRINRITYIVGVLINVLIAITLFSSVEIFWKNSSVVKAILVSVIIILAILYQASLNRKRHNDISVKFGEGIGGSILLYGITGFFIKGKSTVSQYEQEPSRGIEWIKLLPTK